MHATNRIQWILMALSMGTGAAFGESRTTVEVKIAEGSYPAVFLTSEEVRSVRARAKSQDWAKAAAASVLKEADNRVAAKLEIPHEGGQWPHWFSCKKDGAGLKSTSPTQHICPVCQTVYSGNPYDQVYVTRRHSYWLGGLRQLGVAYALSSQPAYADRARAILLEYASFYQDLKRHDVHGGVRTTAARLTSQTLEEAVALCHICMGYDLVHDALCFTIEDHRTIEKKLIRPMVETIQRNDAGVSNWQSWHNAAVGCAGFLLRDRTLVDWAVNGKSGFLMQMERSVLPTGMWYESSPSYHWYALSAHVYLMETACRTGVDLYGLPIVKKMFDGPMRQLFPDLTFPAMNDSHRHSIKSERALYEVAYRRFKEPNYVPILQPRDSLEALLWGVDTLPAPFSDTFRLTSSNSADEGLAVLRDPTGKAALFLDYAPRSGGHIQPARLEIILFAHGDERFVDPGCLSYGNPMHGEWYRQTIAHNTVVVNETSQKAAPAALKAFADAGKFALIRATCDKAYPETILDRTVLMTGSTVVDVFLCTAANESTFDLPLHVRGTLGNLPAAEPLKQLSDRAGYRALKEVRRVTGPYTQFEIDTGNEGTINVQVFDRSESYTAKGFGATPTELLPMILRRQRGNRATFAAVYQLLDKGRSPVKAACTLDAEVTVTVGDASVSVGSDTCVQLSDGTVRKRYTITADGIAVDK